MERQFCVDGVNDTMGMDGTHEDSMTLLGFVDVVGIGPPAPHQARVFLANHGIANFAYTRPRNRSGIMLVFICR